MFSADGSKKIDIDWEKYLTALERSYWVFSENNMVNRSCGYPAWDIESRNSKKTAEST